MTTLTWQAIGTDAAVGDLAGPHHADPDLLWARRTRLLALPGHTELPFIVELAGNDMTPEQRDIYRATLENGLPAGYPTRFNTGFVELGKVNQLAILTRKGVIRRFQLAAPRGPSTTQGLPALVPPGNLDRLDTLGVIDDGCCPAHRDFQEHGSRFIYIWDQYAGAPNTSIPRAGSTPWRRYPGGTLANLVGYGEELNAQRIDEILSTLPPARGERDFYAAIRRPQWLRADHAHGSSVLHLFAGRGGARGLARGRADRASSTRPIVFVQLPPATVADASGGSLGLFVLDGARYIVHRTRDPVKRDGTWSTVINISLGSIAGPHDGTTITELALDELVGHFGAERVRLITAAGNSAGRRTHAHATVSDAQRTAAFSVFVPPAQRDESYVEFWVEPSALEQLEFDVKPPGRTQPATVAFGQAGEWRTPDGAVVAAVVAPKKAAQGLHGSMALLALRGTSSIGERPHAPYGIWSVTVRLKANAEASSTTVHAWVERNETIVGRRSGQRTRFVAGLPDDRTAATVSNDTTLGSLANARHVTVVGAYTRSNRRPADDGARGPIRGRTDVKPDVLAPSSESPWLRGLRVPGVLSGSTSRMSGSSAAAPYYARALVDGTLEFEPSPQGGPPLVK